MFTNQSFCLTAENGTYSPTLSCQLSSSTLSHSCKILINRPGNNIQNVLWKNLYSFLCKYMYVALLFRYVKLSSPNINNVLLLGCIITYTSVFMASLGEKDVTLCKVRAYIIMLLVRYYRNFNSHGACQASYMNYKNPRCWIDIGITNNLQTRANAHNPTPISSPCNFKITLVQEALQLFPKANLLIFYYPWRLI